MLNAEERVRCAACAHTTHTAGIPLGLAKKQVIFTQGETSVSRVRTRCTCPRIDLSLVFAGCSSGRDERKKRQVSTWNTRSPEEKNCELGWKSCLRVRKRLMHTS